MTAADGIPVALGLCGGLALGIWGLAEKMRAIVHDRERHRRESEEEDHDATRRSLAEAKRKIIELESKLPRAW